MYIQKMIVSIVISVIGFLFMYSYPSEELIDVMIHVFSCLIFMLGIVDTVASFLYVIGVF